MSTPRTDVESMAKVWLAAYSQILPVGRNRALKLAFAAGYERLGHDLQTELAAVTAQRDAAVKALEDIHKNFIEGTRLLYDGPNETLDRIRDIAREAIKNAKS